MWGGLFFVVGAFPVFRWVVNALKPEKNETADKVDKLTDRHFKRKIIDQESDKVQKTTNQKLSKSLSDNDIKYINKLSRLELEKTVIEVLVNLCEQDKALVVENGLIQYCSDYINQDDLSPTAERHFTDAYNIVMEALIREPHNIRRYIEEQSGDRNIIVGIAKTEKSLRILLCYLFPWIEDEAFKLSLINKA